MNRPKQVGQKLKRFGVENIRTGTGTMVPRQDKKGLKMIIETP